MIEQDKQEQALAKLRDKIEETIGRKMKTPKDFDFLSEQVFEKLHETVSATTLKRIWGYLSETSVPRISTLDILSQYVGYTDWASFMEQVPDLAFPESQDAETVSAKPAPKWNTRALGAIGGGIFILLLIAFAAVFYFIGRQSSSKTDETKPSSSKYVLTIGQKFKRHQDYLKLFGILNAKVLYGQQVPNHPSIWTWGPRITIAIGTMRATVRRCCPPSLNTGRAKVSPKRQRLSEIPNNTITIFDSTSSVLLSSRIWSIPTSSLRESIVCHLCSLILPNLSGSV